MSRKEDSNGIFIPRIILYNGEKIKIDILFIGVHFVTSQNSSRRHLPSSTVTSIPACRKTLHAGKNDRYFDFKNPKIYAHLIISYNIS